jgi:diguanylate cyclase (GGDEF)-like protein/PAS domain S-box-containing protein
VSEPSGLEQLQLELGRLQRRLERERHARHDAERIAERATRELYDQQAALRLLQTVAAACNEASGVDDALRVALDAVCAHAGWPVGHAYLLDREDGNLRTTGIWCLAAPKALESFRAESERMRFPLGVGLPGRVLASGRPAWITQVAADPNFPRAAVAREAGLRAAFAFPVLVQRECVGVLEFFSPEALEPDERLLELMAQIGVQLGRVVERERGERELARLGRRMEVLLSSAGEGIYGVDPAGRTIFVNPAAARMLGWSAEELIGRPIHDVVHGSGDGVRHAGEHCRLHRSARDLGEHHAEEDVFVRRDGSSFPVRYISTSIREGEVVAGAVVTFNDISERQRFEAKLRFLADHDPLTGLVNRRRFEADLERHVAHGARYTPAGAVMLLDLDNFKYINDTLGHHAGDELIRSVAGVLRQRLRETDVVARIGGDEFAVLLPHANAAQAEVVAGNLAEAVRQHTALIGARPLRVTTSIGLTALSERLTAPELLVEADIAMYQAKEAGRDGYALYTPDADRGKGIAAGITWSERIRRALDENRFVFHGQPIIDLTSGRVSQLELLLRMRDEDDLVLPGAFLPVAERFGLIQDIDRWVVREAIRLIAEERTHGRELATLVEINLSGKSVGDPELANLIEHELTLRGVPATCLVFEITETAAIANMEEARHFAARLAEVGCGLALDDFGAGFGSFYYLKYLPLDYIKIDGEFIVNLPRSPVDQRIVRSMVDVARTLGVRTIAESVSDDQTLALLREIGVDYAQGFHVGRPAPVTSRIEA